MFNLSYKFNQNSSSLELAGIPDVLNGDSEETIGILSSWSLKIIGSPVLEGEKEHLDNLMHVILQYSRSYVSGIRKEFISENNIVTIGPSGINHKLLLKSTKKGVNPLEIILDDSELSDLTRCLDLLRFDPRFNIKWNIELDRPFTRSYVLRNFKNSKSYNNLLLSFIIFLSSSFLLFLIPINEDFKIREINNNTNTLIDNNK